MEYTEHLGKHGETKAERDLGNIIWVTQQVSSWDKPWESCFQPQPRTESTVKNMLISSRINLITAIITLTLCSDDFFHVFPTSVENQGCTYCILNMLQSAGLLQRPSHLTNPKR